MHNMPTTGEAGGFGAAPFCLCRGCGLGSWRNPISLCQLCGGDTGEKLKEMNGVMTSETSGARFVRVHVLGTSG